MLPIRTGLAFAITVGAIYALCTVAWTIAPATSLALMNNLFHGLDFTPMVRPGPFDWSGFVVVLLVQSVLSLLAGAFFAWLMTRLMR